MRLARSGIPPPPMPPRPAKGLPPAGGGERELPAGETAPASSSSASALPARDRAVAKEAFMDAFCRDVSWDWWKAQKAELTEGSSSTARS
jgi:hypothetical protein